MILTQQPSAALCHVLLVLHWGDVLACCSVREVVLASASDCGSRPAMKGSMPGKGASICCRKEGGPAGRSAALEG